MSGTIVSVKNNGVHLPCEMPCLFQLGNCYSYFVEYESLTQQQSAAGHFVL